MKKSKAEYLRRKKLKQEAKRRESEHKIDYTVCPVRDTPFHRNMSGDSDMTSALLMLAMMRYRRGFNLSAPRGSRSDK